MTVTKSHEGTLIHYPNNRDMFEFDVDVATVFDDMAQRSIPLYAETHRINAHLAYNHIKELERPTMVADVGASTGGFLEALHREAWVPYSTPIKDVTAYALDISEAMLDKIAEKLPYVSRFEQDVCSMSSLDIRCDVINCSYVIQFLKGNSKQTALHEIRHSMRKGGLLFLSQKELVQTRFATEFQNHYIDFRLENHYTKEEIDAKTRALQGSMFPDSPERLHHMLDMAGFNTIQETARWLQFSSLVAVAR